MGLPVSDLGLCGFSRGGDVGLCGFACGSHVTTCLPTSSRHLSGRVRPQLFQLAAHPLHGFLAGRPFGCPFCAPFDGTGLRRPSPLLGRRHFGHRIRADPLDLGVQLLRGLLAGGPLGCPLFCPLGGALLRRPNLLLGSRHLGRSTRADPLDLGAGLLQRLLIGRPLRCSFGVFARCLGRRRADPLTRRCGSACRFFGFSTRSRGRRLGVQPALIRFAHPLLGQSAQMVCLDELHCQRPARYGWTVTFAVLDEFALTHPCQRDRLSPWLQPHALGGRDCVRRRASCQRRPAVDLEVLDMLASSRHRRRRPPLPSVTLFESASAEGVSASGVDAIGFRCCDTEVLSRF